MTVYVLVSITRQGKKIIGVFSSLGLAGDYAKMHKVEGWHVEEVPHII